MGICVCEEKVSSTGKRKREKKSLKLARVKGPRWDHPRLHFKHDGSPPSSTDRIHYKEGPT